MTRIAALFVAVFVLGASFGYFATHLSGLSLRLVSTHCEESRRLVAECNSTLDQAEGAINECLRATAPDARRHTHRR